MKFPEWLDVWGDVDYRGPCPKEGAEQATYFNTIRREYPDTIGRIALHPKNEGKRYNWQVDKEKAQGMTPGASDIIIPTGFVCEIKRQDHMKSSWEDGQLEYLEAVHLMGGYACVALGWQAAYRATLHFLTNTPSP